MVVAGDHQNATVFGAAGGIGVVEDVAAAIDTRPLAVPHGEHAVVLGAGKQVQLLRTPDGSRREVFIDRGLKDDMVFLQVRLRCPESLINAGQAGCRDNRIRIRRC